MAGRCRKTLHLLQLVRLEVFFSAVSNIWLMTLLAGPLEPVEVSRSALQTGSLSLTLLLGAVIAGGLSVYGMSLNDAFDARHDRTFSPHRPVAAGRVSLVTALVLGVLGLLAALLAAVALGMPQTVLCILTALAILFYNLTGKFLPAVGIVLLGLMRALNMFIPYPWVAFAWPIWLTMTHVMICATIGYVLEGKRPRLHGSAAWGLCAGWVFWTLTLILWMDWRNEGSPGLVHGRPMLWLGPLMAASVFIMLASWTMRHKMRPLRARRLAGASFTRLAMLWLIAYDAVWLLGAEIYGGGLLLAFLFFFALGVVHLVDALSRLNVPTLTYQVRAMGTGD